MERGLPLLPDPVYTRGLSQLVLIQLHGCYHEHQLHCLMNTGSQ